MHGSWYTGSDALGLMHWVRSSIGSWPMTTIGERAASIVPLTKSPHTPCASAPIKPSEPRARLHRDTPGELAVAPRPTGSAARGIAQEQSLRLERPTLNMNRQCPARLRPCRRAKAERLEQKSVNLAHLTLPEIIDFYMSGDSSCLGLNGFRFNPDIGDKRCLRSKAGRYIRPDSAAR